MRRRKIHPKPEKISESVLCERFTAFAREVGFKVYAETADFDMLLVAGEGVRGFKPGEQVGVQAKLTPSIPVLWQALPRNAMDAGPHYYVVLVPRASDEFEDIARILKITTIEGDTIDYIRNNHQSPVRYWAARRWHRHEPRTPCWVPDCEVVGMVAGTSAPQKLTKWKLEAIKLCLLAEERGFLLSSDFLQAGISMLRWRQKGWIEPTEFVVENGKRMRRYRLANENCPPHVLYSAITASLVAQRKGESCGV